MGLNLSDIPVVILWPAWPARKGLYVREFGKDRWRPVIRKRRPIMALADGQIFRANGTFYMNANTYAELHRRLRLTTDD